MDERTETFERIWAVFRKYRTLLYHRAQRVTGGAEPAEDALADALVRVLERWERLRELTDPQLLAYCAAVVRSCAVDAARRSGKRQRTEEPLPEADSLSGDAPQPSAEEMLLLSEDRDLVCRAMLRLTEEERQLILQRYYLEYSYEEIGAQRGEKPDSVRVRLYRIRKKLLKLLKAEGYEHG